MEDDSESESGTGETAYLQRMEGKEDSRRDVETITRRICPWCGGDNLILRGCHGIDPKHHASYHYWEDPDCGYKEKTTADEYYDYEKSVFVTCEREIISIHKPAPPRPEHKQQEYIRNGVSVPITEGQLTLGES